MPHTVLFAESDGELDEVVGDVLARSLVTDGVVVVVATAAHRRQFEDRMARSGVDLDRARRDGLLIELDVAETLDRLTPRGSLDLTAFDDVVGSVVRSASARGPVQAFGEIVGLLWDQGRVQEAIELEAAWNGLLEETGASLVCGYPSTLIDTESAHDVLAVCALHSSALDNEPFERVWHFPGEPVSVAAARRQVAAALRARGVSGVTRADTELTVSELVANVVRHSNSECSVLLRLDEQWVRVEVGDRSTDVPVIRAVDVRASAGRGLHLLDALADRWGVDLSADGKVVWAELAR